MVVFLLFSIRLIRRQNAEDVVLAHDEVLGTFHFGLAAGVFPEENAVTGFDVERDQLAIVEPFAVAYRDDFAFVRFLLRRIGDDNAVARSLFFVDALHYN